MAKVLLTADSHFGLYREFSKPLSTGGTTRLQDIINVHRQMVDYVKQHKIQFAVHAGDLFDQGSRIPVAVHNAVTDWVMKLYETGVGKVILVRGNHDHAIQDGTVNTLQTLRLERRLSIIERPAREKLGDQWWGFVPFLEDNKTTLREIKKMSKEVITVLIAHVGLRGAKVGEGEYRVKEPLRTRDLSPESFKQVFLGHFHKRQRMTPNVRYIGSPLDRTFEDLDDEKGFMIYDTVTNKVKIIKTQYPHFKRHRYETGKEEYTEENIRGHYIRVEVCGGCVGRKEILERYTSAAAVSLRIEAGKVDRPRISRLKISTSLPKLIKQYLKERPPEEQLSHSTLLKIGEKILRLQDGESQ